MYLRALFLSLAALTFFGQGVDAKPKVAPAQKVDKKPRVQFVTSLGSFTLELDADAAPKTVENFLNYVNSGFYKETTFHRVISTFMVQGGGFDVSGKQKKTDAPIENEAKQALDKGLSNVRGSVAMARTNNPNSATSQFFINVVDNPRLDYPGGGGSGYCVFGHVIEGMDTIDKIRDVKTKPGDSPIEMVIIGDAVVVEANTKKPKKT
jgi:cyclophilin family peptidyl-prolyl cis-trans isomerase